jgi:chromosome segregation ATPase
MGEKQILELRLKQLKAEWEAGQKMLAELEARQAAIQETLDRIRVAIRELEQELAKADLSIPESGRRRIKTTRQPRGSFEKKI